MRTNSMPIGPSPTMIKATHLPIGLEKMDSLHTLFMTWGAEIYLQNLTSAIHAMDILKIGKYIIHNCLGQMIS